MNRDTGQGFLVAHGGNCYVIVPQHVHGSRATLSLSIGSPPVVGEARVFQTFAPGMDLSVGFVTGGLDGRCTHAFNDLPRNIDPLVAPGGAVTIVTVSAAGHVQRIDAQVESLSYETMLIDVVDDGAASGIARGTSGAFVFVGDTPIGMIVRAPTVSSAEALRLDAIVARVERLLSGAYDPSPDDRPLDGDLPMPESAGLIGLASTITRCSAEPLTPETSCWAMADGAGPLMVAPGNTPFVIEVDVGGDPGFGAVSLVRLSADVADGMATAPRTVLIERAAGTGSRRSWLSYGRADMSPFGDLAVPHGAAPRAAAIRLTILDVWSPDLPMRLDAIEIR